MGRHNWAGPLLAGGLLAAVLAGAGASAWGRVAGPEINLQIGPYHVLSRTTTTPNCHPLAMACMFSANQAPRGATHYYSIWVLSVSEVPVPGGIQAQLNSARLLTLAVRP